jgi:hypothetical protein
MEEKRKLERFELNAPARVLLESGSSKIDEYNLTTRDVSSAGAFLYSSQSLPEGANVRMEFLISLDTLQRIAGEKGKAKVRVKGKVIRSDSDGIAIRFDNKYKITALDSNNSHNGLH